MWLTEPLATVLFPGFGPHLLTAKLSSSNLVQKLLDSCVKMDVIDPNTEIFLSPAASVDQCVMSYFLLVIWV